VATDDLSDRAAIFGAVTAVSEHRFVLESGDVRYLADIEPESTSTIGLQEGDRILIRGELKETEIKVTEIVMGPGTPYLISRGSL
jgi:hypothetical protein